LVSCGARVAAFLVAIGAAGGSTIASQSGTSAGSTPPLVLRAMCEGGGQTATLRVRVENRSDRDTAVLLGKLVGTDQTRVIDSLVVMTIRPATGADEDFAFVNPQHAMLKGRTAPWIVPIRAGDAYEVEAPVRFFLSRLTYTLLDPQAIAGTRLMLDARPTASAKVWTGRIETVLDSCP
jgi:hypothetical protein